MEMEMIEGAVAETPVALTAGAEVLLERLTEVLGALDRVLAKLEAPQTEVRAGAVPEVKRKTVPLAVTNLLTKQGVSLDALGSEVLQAGALDSALASLSLEQRIAVKAQLLRAGVLS